MKSAGTVAVLALFVLLSFDLFAQLTTGTVDFNVNTLHDMEQVTVSLSDNSSMVLVRDYVVDRSPASYTWVGSVQSDVTSRAFITVKKPFAVGTIQTSSKLYELTITEGPSDPVQQIDPSTLPREADPLQQPIFSDGFENGSLQSAVNALAACDDTPASVDVLVLYTDDANSAEGDIKARIHEAVDMANDSFLLSHIGSGAPDGIDLKLNLVHMQMVEVEEGSTQDAMTDFQANGDGFVDEVHDLRNQFNADLSILIMESFDFCGQAATDIVGQEEKGFAIVRRSCVKNHTFTHEIAHLFGASHDKYALQKYGIPPPYPGSAYGYTHLGLITGWKTIMAYDDACGDAFVNIWCPRPGFFSSPDYSHSGNPTGTSDTDNRKQLIEAAPTIACYRDSQPTNTQTIYFEGTVQSLGKFGDGEFPNIDVGDKIWGTYKLNLDAAEYDQTSADPSWAVYGDAVTDVEINVGPYSFFNIEPDEVSVRNNSDYSDLGQVDLYAIYMYQNVGGSIGGWLPDTFVLQLVDPSASAFVSDELPQSVPSPDDFISDSTILRMPFSAGNSDPNISGHFSVNASFETHILIAPVTQTSPLNDTGIDWGGNYPSGNNADCTGETIAAQDCSHGRDATHNDDSDGHAGFSFTKLDANGNALPASAITWSCVRDNVTSLVWESKTDDGGLRDTDNTYTWYNPDPNTNGGAVGIQNGGVCVGSNCDTYSYVQAVNAQSQALCGARDWRMPWWEELLSIVDYGRYNPTIDTAYFPYQMSSHVWSGSPSAYGSDYAWGVYFGSGGGNTYGRNDGDLRVRLVRGGQ